MKGLTDDELFTIEHAQRPTESSWHKAEPSLVELIDKLVARGLLVWVEEKTSKTWIKWPSATAQGKLALECERLARGKSGWPF